jgi:tryptophan synthase alpha chain
VDGLLVLDLPPEEADEYQDLMKQAGLASIWLIAPTTPEGRIRSIALRGTGFIYYVSREGVTGMREDIASSLSQRVGLIRKYTDLPIAVGFGVSTSDQVCQVAANCDAIVVGSAIVNQIAEHGNDSEMPTQLGEFVKDLASGLK